MIGCLCIHGFTGGPYELEPLANYIRNNTNWDLVVPALPGHGEELNLNEVTFDKWIETAESKLQEMLKKYEKIYLIGFSMGGMIACYLAAKYDVNKLVLLSPSRRYISLKQLSKDTGQVIRQGITGKLKNNKFYQHYKSKKGYVPIRALLEFVKCMRYIKPHLHKVKCPVLITQGLKDPTVPYKATHYLDKEISAKTEVIYFYDSEHHICLGPDKEVLIEKVYSFLNKKRVDTAI